MDDMGDYMYDLISQHRNIDEFEQIDIQWARTEDLIEKIEKKEDFGRNCGLEGVKVEQCFNTELQLDTDKIYGRKKQKRTMMISASETVVGKLGKDTCSADILCVIDISGSMGGEKLNNVKTTLKYLVHILQGSRLALIAFDTKSETIMNFKNVTEASSENMFKVIESLQARGSTNITAAIENVQSLLASRQSRNQVCSVFFLSDGQHNQGPISQEIMFGEDYKKAKSEYTLHTFGYGDDHDAALMQGMAERKSGNYYFVHDVKRVDECFVDCLGMVTTALAESGMIRITLKPSASGSVIRPIESHGPHAKVVNEKTVECEMLTIYAGLHKDFVFDVEFIPGGTHGGEPEEIEAELYFEFNKLGAQDLTKTSKIVKFRVVDDGGVDAQSQQGQVDSSASNNNSAVTKNILRVKAATVLKTVNTLCASNQKEIALTLVTGFISELEKVPTGLTADPLVQCLNSVMTTTKDLLLGDPSKSNFKIENYLVQQINIFSNQASAPLFDQGGIFATARQQENVAKLKNQ